LLQVRRYRVILPSRGAGKAGEACLGVHELAFREGDDAASGENLLRPVCRPQMRSVTDF